MHTAMENVGVQMKMGTHDTVKVAELSDTFANSCECISSVIVLRSVSWRFRSFLSKTWSGIHLQLNSNMTVCVYVCDFAAYRRWFAIILLFVFLFLFFFSNRSHCWNGLENQSFMLFSSVLLPNKSSKCKLLKHWITDIATDTMLKF